MTIIIPTKRPFAWWGRGGGLNAILQNSIWKCIFLTWVFPHPPHLTQKRESPGWKSRRGSTRWSRACVTSVVYILREILRSKEKDKIFQRSKEKKTQKQSSIYFTWCHPFLWKSDNSWQSNTVSIDNIFSDLGFASRRLEDANDNGNFNGNSYYCCPRLLSYQETRLLPHQERPEKWADEHMTKTKWKVKKICIVNIVLV